jgi:cholesterol transport system auxiliary component
MNRRMLLSGGLALSGCSVLPSQTYQQRRDWPLSLVRAKALPARRGGRVLLIRTVAAAPGLDVRGVQSLLKDGSLNVDYYEQWAVPPAQAIEEGLRRWLTDAGLFAAVVAPGSRIAPDLVLEAELITMRADVGEGTAKVSLALVLAEPKGERTRIRLQRTETAVAPLTGTDPPAIVAALREAACAVLRQAEASLRGAITGK